MKNFTNLIIIDASGSMGSKRPEVIGGLKQIFSDIKKETSPEVNTTTIVVDFANSADFRVLVNSNNQSQLTDAVANNYQVRGATALYDAIGRAFRLVPKKQDGVFVSILTDGEENDSKEFKFADIKALIEKKRNKKWAITFMGTSEESLKDAQALGVSVGNTMYFMNNGEGVTKGLSTSNSARTAYYTATLSNSTIDTENLLLHQDAN